MDFIGVTRTIDQAIYMLLNSLAIILWRIDSAIIGMSLYSYSTQDWLTGHGGGVWTIMDWLLDTSGLFGLNTWTLFAGLALMLWGLARIARPFLASTPVHPGKLLIFFVLSYVVISQGSALMQDIEGWRLEAGSAIYQGVASSGSPSLSAPSVPATSDPLTAPADLDGQSPIRGWEAVASSYFLATSAADLHQPYPPEAFRLAYCLYNPEQPIESQKQTNAQGCSPERAWDEWDVVDRSIFDLFGIDIGELTDAFDDFFGFFDDDIDLDDFASPVDFIQHHPENRELGIRQAQAGAARLALGFIVALFPIVEANISLMLALAASFIYLTLPIVLLFGFFLATEAMTNRLLMQFVAIIIRTLIINGIVALFLLLLMNTAINGSLTAYLGLVGVGLVGGFFLARVAAATMKESLGQSFGALGSVWLGTTTGLLGQSAGQPARAALGVAKMGAAAALLGAGGALSALDLAETSYEGFRSGGKDLRRGAPGTMDYLDRQSGRLPASLARLTQSATGADQLGGQPTDMMTGLAAPLALSALSLSNRLDTGSSDPLSYQPAGSRPSLTAALPAAAGNGATPARSRQAEVDGWVSQMVQAQQTGRGTRLASERGRDLLGEELAWKAERALGRRSPAEVSAVLNTARQVGQEQERRALIDDGRLTGQALTAVRDRLDDDTAQTFSGQTGAWDLAALTAVALQQPATASPEAFRQAAASAASGPGQDAPGQSVPRQLGLDPVAAGAYYPAINRFSRLSDEAGLTPAQREQLLAEAHSGQVSEETRAGIEAALKQQREQGRAQGVTAEAIVAAGLAMPATLSGPEQVWTTPKKAAPAHSGQAAGSKSEAVSNGATSPVKPDQKRAVLTQSGGQVHHQPDLNGQPAQLGQTLKTALREPTPAGQTPKKAGPSQAGQTPPARVEPATTQSATPVAGRAATATAATTAAATAAVATSLKAAEAPATAAGQTPGHRGQALSASLKQATSAKAPAAVTPAHPTPATTGPGPGQPVPGPASGSSQPVQAAGSPGQAYPASSPAPASEPPAGVAGPPASSGPSGASVSHAALPKPAGPTTGGASRTLVGRTEAAPPAPAAAGAMPTSTGALPPSTGRPATPPAAQPTTAASPANQPANFSQALSSNAPAAPVQAETAINQSVGAVTTPTIPGPTPPPVAPPPAPGPTGSSQPAAPTTPAAPSAGSPAAPTAEVTAPAAPTPKDRTMPVRADGPQQTTQAGSPRRQPLNSPRSAGGKR